jgi:predicted nucleotide-binding protein
MANILRRLAVYLGLVSDPASKRRVMVIYGHDVEAYRAMLGWLRVIGLEPLQWSDLVKLSGGASPYNGQVIEQALREAQAVICLFTPDEHVVARGASATDMNEWRLQARPNVLIELGMALAKHRQRTFLVVLGDQRLPSDLDGFDHIRLDRTSGPLYELAHRLRNAGCDVKLTGTAWLDPENFPRRDDLPLDPMG